MSLEYVVIAYGPDNHPVGDHVTCEPEDAMNFVRNYLDEEDRDGACVTVNVVRTDNEQDEKEG